MVNKSKIHIKEINRVVTKMCKYVNIKPKDIDTMSKDWYMKHAWIEEQQEEFTEWLSNELYNRKDLREAIMHFPRKHKVLAQKTAIWFVFEYGWRLKEKV